MNATNDRQLLLQQRLNALQLKVWYPRQPMAGSRLQDFIETLPESQPPEAVIEPTAVIEPKENAAPVGPPPPPTEESQTPPPAAETQTPSFEVVRQTPLGVEFVQHWWFHQGVLLVDTRPADCATELQAAADQLLSALLRVCTQATQPEVLWSIDWPLFEHRGIKHDWQEAQFYVQQKWQALTQAHSVERVLLFGPDSRGLLGLSETPLPSTQRWIETESSLQLMHSSAAKRALWQALQPWLKE